MTIGPSSLFLKTLSSRGVYIRPLVMVTPPFVPECIKPKCLAHGNEGEATPTTTVGILLLSYMVDTLPHWFFDRRWWSLLLLPLVHNKGLAQGEEGEATPTTTVSILLLSYMVETLPHRFFDCHVWSPDRLKVNSKCRLILFLANPGH